MAASIQLRNALQGLGFSQDAATYIVNTQGYDTPEDFALLTDDEAGNVCKITRRPGGTVNNHEPNPGISVSMKAENNLKLMCYYFRYKQRTSRALVVNQATVANVRKYISLAKNEKNYSEPDAPDIKPSGNWTRIIEIIEDYFTNVLGTTKIPLAYIIREEVNVPAEADDPEANYTTFTEELIARAPHFEPTQGNNAPVHTQAYKDDNNLVWNKLAALFRDKDCWTYMRHTSRTRDGRAAFISLKGHYLGKNNVNNLANQAERKLQNTTYTGEGRRWNFEKYVKTHVDQHQILQDLTRHGYSGIDPRSKVRYLIDGIKTKDLDNVKTRILSDETLRSDFDACVNLYQDFIKQTTKDEPRQSNISALGRGSGDREEQGGYDDVEPDMSVEDRYYNKTEYDKLSLAKKKGLSIKRKKRGHRPGARDSKTKKSASKQTPTKAGKTFKKRVISAIKSHFGKSLEEEDDAASKDKEPEEGSNNNRKLKALKRKRV